MSRQAPPAVPRYADRPTIAAEISARFFPIAARTLERWPLAWRVVNGRAVARLDDALAEARRRLEAAPAIRGGKAPAVRYSAMAEQVAA